MLCAESLESSSASSIPNPGATRTSVAPSRPPTTTVMAIRPACLAKFVSIGCWLGMNRVLRALRLFLGQLGDVLRVVHLGGAVDEVENLLQVGAVVRYG